MSGQETAAADAAVDEQSQFSEAGRSAMRTRVAVGVVVLLAGIAAGTVVPLLVVSGRRSVAEAVIGGAAVSLLGGGIVAGRGRGMVFIAWGGPIVLAGAIAWDALGDLFPVTPLLAWGLVLICVLRAEHVWASDVWIAQSGEEFEERKAKEQESNLNALLAAGKRDATWRDGLLTPEQRSKLYRDTGGDRLPWLFFGIRSHRLLVAARRGGRITRPLLMLVRLAWLNWSFPVWTGAAVLLIAGLDHSQRLGLPAATLLAAMSLCVNTMGTFVGTVWSGLAMKGVARHHDSWKMKDDAKARAIAEIGYALAATALFILSCAVLVQLLSLQSSAAAANSTVSVNSLTASLSFVLLGTKTAALHFSSAAIERLADIRYLVMAASALAWTIILNSARLMAWPDSNS